MGIYHDLAPFYDALNVEIDYEAWADDVDACIRTELGRPATCLLDLGCGTGSMSIPLAARGWDVIGLDLSEEMLSVAYGRAVGAGVQDKIQWTRQDMSDFSLCGEVDAVVSTLDSLNHLPSPARLTACFRGVRSVLAADGVFLFDMHTKRQFEETYAQEVYTMETEDAFCVWENDYNPSSRLCDFWITLFCRGADGRYTRHDSRETERYFPLVTVRRCLDAAGLTLVGLAGDHDGRPLADNDLRLYGMAKRKEIL